ncbi:hypothetical protein NDU88_012205 [Pleurodeles waltl]|uniref:Uncharacterized protein n=1 Tax=Pleurodeles waltl TaxID=8319 RepID=A0AAV7R2L0_PLEWA|nr:hypothetical protein NDU88_012205 [Pleurodeles waltl]
MTVRWLCCGQRDLSWRERLGPPPKYPAVRLVMRGPLAPADASDEGELARCRWTGGECPLQFGGPTPESDSWSGEYWKKLQSEDPKWTPG